MLVSKHSFGKKENKMAKIPYWKMQTDPVQYTDDVYYIGVTKAPAWLIKSTDGLIVLDTAYPETLYLVMLNIAKLGFDYRDIKHIIHSHGHLDHFGGTPALVELTGAKTYIGERDVDAVKGLRKNASNFIEIFEPDVIIHDGDVITIGDKEFHFLSTPGHTDGTMSIFFKTTYKGKEYQAGMFGGAGLNTLSLEYLDRMGYPHANREIYLDSIDRLYKYEIDVHLGNHLGDNKHLEKAKLMTEDYNPFIDPTSWRSFLDRRRKEAIELFESGK